MSSKIEVPLIKGDAHFVVKIDEFVCLHRVNNGIVEKEPFYKLPDGNKVTLIIEVK